jgi:STE24 endopeptidase
VILEQWLERLNHTYLKQHGLEIPAGFESVADAGLLAKSREYTLAKMGFSTWISLINAAGLLFFLYSGLWDVYNGWIFSLPLTFVLQGCVYFLGLLIIASLLGLPFGWYQTFRLEQRFGFNTQTLKLWIIDNIKSILLSVVFMGLLLSGALWLIQRFPNTWWLWVWSFFLIFSLVLMVIAPLVIEPMFNKFKPVDQPELLEAIRSLMQKAGLRVSRVFESDASKRSRHTNAYFTGIGPVKRIVLFDTLLQKTTIGELLAVLAHEAGHWKKKHILKRLLVTETLALGVLYAVHLALRQTWISGAFGLNHGAFFSDVFGLLFVGSIPAFFMEPISSYFSRKQEREADAYAVALTGQASALADALIGLFKDNLSNLHPHPWYAAFHYSHPPIVERVRYLRQSATTQKG